MHEYDDPRRRGPDCILQAVEHASGSDSTDTNDPAGEHAAALLFKGTQITSQATASARGLLNRIRG